MLKLNQYSFSMLTGCKFFWLLLLIPMLCLSAPLMAHAQQTQAVTPAVSIVLGSTKFPVNEYFTISFTLQGAALNRYSAFPDIEGFKKSGKSSTTTTRIVGGTTTTELTITQRYAAYQEGEFELPPFTMTINGEVARSEGATLMAGPQQAAAAAPPGGALQGLGLLDQLFGKKKPEQYVEPKDHAFMALLPDRTSVYVGEGLHVGLYFYLTPGDQGLLDFYNFAGQLPVLCSSCASARCGKNILTTRRLRPKPLWLVAKPTCATSSTKRSCTHSIPSRCSSRPSRCRW